MSQNAQSRSDPQRGDSTAAAFASVLQKALATDDTHRQPQGISLGYLDLTVNGEAPTSLLGALDEHVHTIGNKLLGVPVKLRRAPADYHSTEQSEMDGPPSLVSLRLLARRHERCRIGQYDDTFLCAQAVSTWQAMLEQGRSCFLLVVDGTLEDATESLAR